MFVYYADMDSVIYCICSKKKPILEVLYGAKMVFTLHTVFAL